MATIAAPSVPSTCISRGSSRASSGFITRQRNSVRTPEGEAPLALGGAGPLQSGYRFDGPQRFEFRLGHAGQCRHFLAQQQRGGGRGNGGKQRLGVLEQGAAPFLRMQVDLRSELAQQVAGQRQGVFQFVLEGFCPGLARM